ncbi:hypothetical protein RJT34_18796 [Clitoria ternatea]|uniref:Uncharacterized protein n=1 Tax=Clitoria ternatea TaxID=43366 RepID=A0AAN9JCD1_CLITE
MLMRSWRPNAHPSALILFAESVLNSSDTNASEMPPLFSPFKRLGTMPAARKKATITPKPTVLSTFPLAGIVISAKGCSFPKAALHLLKKDEDEELELA